MSCSAIRLLYPALTPSDPDKYLKNDSRPDKNALLSAGRSFPIYHTLQLSLRRRRHGRQRPQNQCHWTAGHKVNGRFVAPLDVNRRLRGIRVPNPQAVWYTVTHLELYLGLSLPTQSKLRHVRLL